MDGSGFPDERIRRLARAAKDAHLPELFIAPQTPGADIRPLGLRDNAVLCYFRNKGCRGGRSALHACAWFEGLKKSNRQTDLISVHGGNLKQVKSIWWMPWRREAMKDVARCDKPRGAVSRL